MVLCLLSVLGKNMQFASLARTQIIGGGLQQLFGIQTGFNSTGKVNFLFRIKKRHFTDLLEVILDRVRCCTRNSNLLDRLIGLI